MREIMGKNAGDDICSQLRGINYEFYDEEKQNTGEIAR